MKYTVTYNETLSRTFIVDADTKEEAEEIVRSAAYDGCFVMSEKEDFVDDITYCEVADEFDMSNYPYLEL